MKKFVQICILILLVYYCKISLATELSSNENTTNNIKNWENVGRELIEQGRTLVHHAAKRFMIILPAIFFKLGIAFTLLILVTLVAVNNGIIGFLLLVVGLSSVLARLQESRRPATIPVPYLSPFPAAQHIWDRSDSDLNHDRTSHGKLAYNGYVEQSGQHIAGHHPELANYYSKYVVSQP